VRSPDALEPSYEHLVVGLEEQHARVDAAPLAVRRSDENARDRTSATTAILGTAPCARELRSTIVASSDGGRLSTTNQPRSSRHLAAVERPAPDSPVTTTTSSGRAASVMTRPRR
jgi:hypothetical protein